MYKKKAIEINEFQAKNVLASWREREREWKQSMSSWAIVMVWTAQIKGETAGKIGGERILTERGLSIEEKCGTL